MGLEEEAKEVLNQGLSAQIDKWHGHVTGGRAITADHLAAILIDAKAITEYRKLNEKIEKREEES